MRERARRDEGRGGGCGVPEINMDRLHFQSSFEGLVPPEALRGVFPGMFSRKKYGIGAIYWALIAKVAN